MVEGGATGDSSSPAAATTSRVTSSFVKVGDRTRFTVELTPGETTIVSWKKLMKDASKADAAAAATATATATAATATAAVAADGPQPPANAVPALESRLAPGQPIANELNDAPPPNRFSAVIEKIERLYTGKDSSDEAGLDDIPDDDQYDTEDSFIDDAELDEYFEVDKSKTKHDGYFVNRGMLEKVEPLESANQQPKKRRRNEVSKAPGNNTDDKRGYKHLKAGKKSAVKSALSADKAGLPAHQGPSSKNSDDSKVQYHQKMAADPAANLRPSLGDTPSALSGNSDKQRTEVLVAISPSGKLKDLSENGDKSENMHITQSLKPNHFEESKSVAQQMDKSGMHERIDLNLPDYKQSAQPMKNSILHKKEGSSVKSKANVLDKAIRELEKLVAESRPAAPDTQDADSSGQSIKRRLPREIKQKLAKVARLAHATNGKVSEELLSRLMGILGHWIQIRTLKRHLRVMVTTGLSAKQEKDEKFQEAKKEVFEIIKMRIPSLMSEAAEQQIGGSGDLQESGHSEKTMKGQLCIDTALEDKICDLYDIFVDGHDEDGRPQVRKLYAELAELWPKGVMDNHEIKRAICRAKERKRASNDKNKEKVRRKRVPASNAQQTVRVVPSSAVESQFVDVRVVSDPALDVVIQQNRFSTITTIAPTAPINTHIVALASITATTVPHFAHMKKEKAKVNHKQPLIDGRIVDVGVKKKIKKRAQHIMGELPLRPQKLSSHPENGRQKQHKHVSAQIHTAPPNSSYSEFRFEPLT